MTGTMIAVADHATHEVIFARHSIILSRVCLGVKFIMCPSVYLPMLSIFASFRLPLYIVNVLH